MGNRNGKRLSALFQFGTICLVWIGLAAILQFQVNKPSQQFLNEASRAQHRDGRFVFADLDGDQKPDLASVEMQRQRPEATDYSIHLQLSHGVESAIGVRAPFGGLRLAARDVNGDDNLDLILTSNLDASFVEVLLNDGHGNFSVAPPDFLKAQNESELGLNRPAGPEVGEANLALARSSLGKALATRNDDYSILSPTAGGPWAGVPDVLRTSVRLRLGRSPPVEVFL
jgi:hypothetical protein